MKKLLIAMGIFFLFQTCTKNDTEKIKCDCSMGYPEPEGIFCPGQICQSDTCQTYFNIWKRLFLSKNEMSGDYFDNHITLCSSTVHKWAEGSSFEIFYKVKVGWAEYRLLDKFIIYIASNLYPGLDIPRNVLLSESQISTVLNSGYFSSKMSKITPVSELKYSSDREAMKALINASYVDTFCFGSVSWPQKSFDKYFVGHPYFKASGVLNWEDNKCIEGSIDLITGETNIQENICYILFCLSAGTQIMQPEGSTKAIEKIKINDKILSFNISSMKPEADIVEGIDSVIHNDMITIVFNDMTTNTNTADHPYFVKRKGWSSYKPKVTSDKYKIKAGQLQIGDTCLKYSQNNLKEVYIKAITVKNEPILTYNISKLKKNKSYFANGIVVSNESN